MNNHAELRDLQLTDLVAQLGLPDVKIKSRRLTPQRSTNFEYAWRCGCRAHGKSDDSVDIRTCPAHRSLTPIVEYSEAP
jgi:hypothetical protein